MRLYEKVKNEIAIIYYKLFPVLNGRGYSRFKNRIIQKKIKYKKVHYNSYLDERVIEIPWIIKELKKLDGNILDAGSTLNQEFILKELNHFKKIFITTLYPEKDYFNNYNISYTYEDFEKISFKESFFNVITCISTLEHIGFDNNLYNYGNFKKEKKNKNKLKIVLKNILKILKKNGVLLITIPFGKKGYFSNMQQFDKKELSLMFKQIKPKKYFVEYYKIYKNKWIKCRDVDCENIKPNVEIFQHKKQVISANSIALIKIIK